VLQASTGGQFAQRLASILVLGGTAAPAVVLIFGLAAIVLSLVQAALMLFRQAALVILAGVLPLAAAGSLAPLTRPWIRKTTSLVIDVEISIAISASLPVRGDVRRLPARSGRSSARRKPRGCRAARRRGRCS
jgi:hypothetical protein